MITKTRVIAALVIPVGVVLSIAAPANAVPSDGNNPVNSPGVASGNVVQAPVHVPVNTCGNSVDIVGALNPTFGNGCTNG